MSGEQQTIKGKDQERGKKIIKKSLFGTDETTIFGSSLTYKIR
jgi:hypothetical protein